MPVRFIPHEMYVEPTQNVISDESRTGSLVSVLLYFGVI